VRVTGVTTNLRVADIDAARGFYTDYLGLTVEGFNLGWVARYGSPDGRACVQLVTRDASSPQNSVISVQVGNDVDEAYAEAQRRGYEIVHPLTDEPWGVRRFFVRAPRRERDQHRQPPRRVGRRLAFHGPPARAFRTRTADLSRHAESARDFGRRS